MKKGTIQSIIGTLILFYFNTCLISSQPVKINAGDNQIINWEKTTTAHLQGSVSSEKIKVEWACPQNSDVVFKNPSNPVTDVTFPRPGYYLLILFVYQKEKEIDRSTVVINVFKPNSYKDRLSDLINLMTVEEKINQLTNETDSIPRLGIPAYNYWSEALHGVLESGATSFPQCVALGSSWEPDLVQPGDH